MHLPAPLRAAVGIVATAADEAKHLPDRAIELPMLAVSTALQVSLRAQQRYARLTARGDEALAAAMSRRRGGDEPPPWATFDDETSITTPPAPAAEPTAPTEPPPAAKTAEKPTKKTTASTVSAKKTTARKRTASKPTAAKSPNGKAISPPRHTAPSRFDTIGSTDTADTE